MTTTKKKPGPKRKQYDIPDPFVRALPGSQHITTANQYNKLVDFIKQSKKGGPSYVRLGATVPPTPQMVRNEAVRYQAAKVLKAHGLDPKEIIFSSPRHFYVHYSSIPHPVMEDLGKIKDAVVEGLNIDVKKVKSNKRREARSVWAVALPDGKIEIIERLGDPRRAYRWMSNHLRPWNT